MKHKNNLDGFEDICIRFIAGHLISVDDILFKNLIIAELPAETQKIRDKIGLWTHKQAKQFLLQKWNEWFKSDYIKRWGIKAWEKRQIEK